MNKRGILLLVVISLTLTLSAGVYADNSSKVSFEGGSLPGTTIGSSNTGDSTIPSNAELQSEQCAQCLDENGNLLGYAYNLGGNRISCPAQTTRITKLDAKSDFSRFTSCMDQNSFDVGLKSLKDSILECRNEMDSHGRLWRFRTNHNKKINSLKDVCSKNIYEINLLSGERVYASETYRSGEDLLYIVMKSSAMVNNELKLAADVYYAPKGEPIMIGESTFLSPSWITASTLGVSEDKSALTSTVNNYKSEQVTARTMAPPRKTDNIVIKLIEILCERGNKFFCN